MKKIWYLLKCPKGDERNYVQKYQDLGACKELYEVVCFEYQRMMRYNGSWHLERRALLPGYIFLSGNTVAQLEEKDISLVCCEPPYIKKLCGKDNLVAISKGVIKDGMPMVTSGPLKGHEGLIRRIDRHKRTAEIEIPLGTGHTQVTVGLEIYEKTCSKTWSAVCGRRNGK